MLLYLIVICFCCKNGLKCGALRVAWGGSCIRVCAWNFGASRAEQSSHVLAHNKQSTHVLSRNVTTTPSSGRRNWSTAAHRRNCLDHKRTAARPQTGSTTLETPAVISWSSSWWRIEPKMGSSPSHFLLGLLCLLLRISESFQNSKKHKKYYKEIMASGVGKVAWEKVAKWFLSWQVKHKTNQISAK